MVMMMKLFFTITVLNYHGCCNFLPLIAFFSVSMAIVEAKRETTTNSLWNIGGNKKQRCKRIIEINKNKLINTQLARRCCCCCRRRANRFSFRSLPIDHNYAIQFNYYYATCYNVGVNKHIHTHTIALAHFEIHNNL